LESWHFGKFRACKSHYLDPIPYATATPHKAHGLRAYNHPMKSVCGLPSLSLALGLALAASNVSHGAVRVPCKDARIPISVNLLLRTEASLKRTQLWPGLSMLKMPVLFFIDGQRTAWLVGHPKPPTDYVWVCKEYGGICVKKDTVADFNAAVNWDYSVGGVTCLAFRFEAVRDEDSGYQVFVHEYFHWFQGKVFKNGTCEGYGQGYRQGYKVEDAENQTLAALEQLALARALNARANEDQTRYARTFVAIRALRNERWGKRVSDSENQGERAEGTAEYVRRYLLLRQDIKAESGDVGVASIADRLMETPGLEDMQRRRLYWTGFSQCYLIDRAGVRDWKEDVNEGRCLNELMATAYPVTEGERGALIEKAKVDLFDYRAHLEKCQGELARLNGDKDAALADYKDAPGFEIRAELSAQYGNIASVGKTYNLAEDTLYTRIQSYRLDGEGSRLELANRGVIQGATTCFHVSPDTSVTIDSVKVGWTKGTKEFTNLSLDGPGISLELRRPGTWEFDGSTATIKLKAKGKPTKSTE
jgi:hypothetical protein